MTEMDSLDVKNGVGEAPRFEDTDFTPRSELPPVLERARQPDMPSTDNVAAPGEKPARHAADDYFFQSSSAANFGSALRPTVSHTATSPTPKVSVSDVVGTGQLHLPGRSLSVRSSGRPNAHTTISSLSVQSTDSSITVTPQHNLASPARSPAPVYPNQSYAALQYQHHPTRGPAPPLRRAGSQPFPIHNFASALALKHASGAHTSSNSPTLSPGLFNLPMPGAAAAKPEPAAAATDAPGTYASPYLHYTHTHVPKETHVADVDVDPISGRKIINHYEILDELGRGTHGKVKLGRDLNETNSYVAIKIVERYSKRRKLGKLGTTEDKVKKEVAILKKARHPNVVALLEVIDDPSRKKVYIVLEWVEKGEINWRVKGPAEIAMVEARRYEREKSGQTDAYLVAEDQAVFNEAQKRLARQKRRQLRAARLLRRGAADADQVWSIEMAGDHDSESDDDGRSLSRVSTATSDSYPGRHASMKDRLSRQSSRISSRPEMFMPGSPPQYLSLTAEPEDPSTGDRRPSTPRSGSMQNASHSSHEHLSGMGSRGPSSSSLRGIHRRRSSAELVKLSREILDSNLDPELEYVPVMTIDKIRVAFRDTLLGLQYLHYQGIVHRDIKPPNLLSTGQGRVKISDFGVSYLGRPVHEGEPGEELSEAETQDLHDEAKELAKTVGTPAFYAPELCNTDPNEENLPVTKAIDVWALGITLFCMLFARTPFVDTEYVVMRQIADEEIYLPRKRLQPINPKPSSRSNSGTRGTAGDGMECRHELDLVYETIDDSLHDLLKRLLTKDPRKRITLEEVRQHPWVVEDLANKAKWLEETDPSRQSQGKKIEISREELNTAVVPLNLMDRVRVGIKKVTQLGERFGLAGKTGGRARGHSNASDSPVQSAHSSSSTISQDARRSSTRGESAIFSALRASRHHERSFSNFSGSLPDDSGDVYPSETHVNHYGQSDSGDESVGRPRPPHPPSRANTLTSTTPSLATVKQSDIVHRPETIESSPSSPGLPGTPVALASPGGTHLGGLLGGASRRIMKSVRKRTSYARLERVRSIDTQSVDSWDRHSEPSVAISQATAAGHVDPPEALKEPVQPDNEPSGDSRAPSAQRSGYNSGTSTRPNSTMTSPDHLHPTYGSHDFLSRTSSSSSIDSAARHAYVAADIAHLKDLSSATRNLHESDPEDWKKADVERVRRAVQRSKDDAAARTQSPRTRMYASPQTTDCPPSPDDAKPKSHPSVVPPFTNPFDESATSEIPADVSPGHPTAHLPTTMASSSSDLGSAVSVSASHPSMPSVISEASSVDPADRFPSSDKFDPSSDETVDPHDRSALAAVISNHTACVAHGSEPDDDYDDDDDDDDDDSSDSDGGLVMSRRKSNARTLGTAAAPAAAATTATAGAAHNSSSSSSSRVVYSTRKSSRSGSNNTMKKVRTHDSADLPTTHGGEEERRSLEVALE